MSCRGKGKAKHLECYAHKASKKLKSGVMWIGGQSGKQGTAHKYGWGLFLLALLGVSFVAGGMLLITNPWNNPTASQVTYSTTWALDNGTVVVSGNPVSGVLSVKVQPSASAAAENPTMTFPSPIGSRSLMLPYWISTMTLNVYSGQSATGQPVGSTPLTVSSTSYLSTMQSWFNAYKATITANPATPSAWVLGSTPSANPYWSGSFDTRMLPNGVYTCQVSVQWATGATTILGVTIPPPPSLSSSNGQAFLLSTFGLGGAVPQPVLIGMLLFLGIIGVAAVAIIVKRRA